MAKLPSVYKRSGSPVYWGSFMRNGKRKQVALCENKAASQRMLLEYKESLKSVSKYGDTPWQAFKEKFFAWAWANKNKLTVYRDKYSIQYLEEFQKITSLSEINTQLLDDLKTHIKNKSLELQASFKKKRGKKKPFGMVSDISINRILLSLKAIFRKAAEWELMPPLKWELVKKFKVPRGRVHFFTIEEIKILLDFSVKKYGPINPLYTATMLGARAGLRLGEILNLEWADVDFDRKIIDIHSKPFWHTKTYECRTIPMSEDLLAYLLLLPKNTKRVLVDPYGDIYSLNNLSTRYGLFVKRAGLTGSLHKLRHTFASHLVQAGIDLYSVSKLLGHVSIKTTEIYAHLSPISLSGAVSALPKL